MVRVLQMTGPVLDLVYKVRALPRSGQEAVVTGFFSSPGGGFNALAAVRAAGGQACLGGSLGDGPLASVITAQLDAQGITRARPRLAGIDQGCCTVLVEPDGERSFVAAPGAEGQITAGALDAIDLDGTDWVLLSGYTLHYPDARADLADWITALPGHVRFVFDPSPVIAELPDELVIRILSRADWVSANASEAARLTGESDIHRAARTLARGRAGALLRRGADGCLLVTDGQLHDLPAHPVRAVDTNGAGDCHIGSFVTECTLSGDPVRAARYANIAAALSTTREGPATPPPRNEVLALT